MRINHNIAALNTYRQLSMNNVRSQKSLEKLSSGYRINRAGDDAAGLAISEKMRSQIRGLEQAERNAQDGISLIQTAEGALNETHSILQRMRELAVQAKNGTLSSSDRDQIQKEVNQLISELDRISDTTEFNTKKLLNGNVANTATVGGTNTANIDTAELVDDGLEAGTYTLEVTGTANQEVTDGLDAGTGLTVGDITINSTTAADASYGQYQLEVEADPDNSGKKLLTLKDAVTGEVITSQNNVDTSAGTTTLEGLIIDNTAISGEGTFTFEVEGDHTFILQDSGGNTLATKTVTDLNKSEVEIGGIKLDFNYDIANGADTNITVVNNSLELQIGANEGQTMNIAISDMSAEALGVDNIDLTSPEDAETAITTIGEAIEKVSTQRGKLGALQNRLEHTINNLGTSAENLTASESRIRDVDMAKEMMAFTKNNILQQAAQAMLAQANQMPQGVLQLLG